TSIRNKAGTPAPLSLLDSRGYRQLLRRVYTAQWVAFHGFPRDLLEDSVHLLGVLAQPGFPEHVRHRQTDRRTAMDHRVMAVGVQHVDRWLAVPEIVAEKIGLPGDARHGALHHALP